jgi:hypothetical protein
MSAGNWLSKLTGGTVLCVALVLTATGVAHASIGPSPNGTFAGVSCTPDNGRANVCTAVGKYMSYRHGYPLALVEHFDGASWSLQSLPNPRGHNSDALNAVSCPSASYCIAVGYSFDSVGLGSPQTLAERWNGTSWRVLSTPNPAGRRKENYLYGVSCTSSRACTAVGSYVNKHGADAPLAERWNGHSWKVQLTPDPASHLGSGLTAVSCASATSCTAVGTYYTNNQGGDLALVEHWGGHHWRVQGTPRVNHATYVYLNAVSCPHSNACTAVGDSQVASTLVVSSLAERWNGHHWRIEGSVHPPITNDTYLQGVSCPTADYCTAVGSSMSAAGPQIPLAAAWTPSGWTYETTTDPATPMTGGNDAWLYGVSCTDASLCNAVGFYPGSGFYPGITGLVTLAETSAGGVWNTGHPLPGLVG